MKRRSSSSYAAWLMATMNWNAFLRDWLWIRSWNSPDGSCSTLLFLSWLSRHPWGKCSHLSRNRTLITGTRGYRFWIGPMWERSMGPIQNRYPLVPVISESGSVTNDCTSIKDAAKVNGFGVVVGLLPAFHVIHSCLTLFTHIPLLLNTH